MVLADGRLLSAPDQGSVMPQRLRIGPLRYVDLVLSFGATAAPWAALPWILEDLCEHRPEQFSSDAPLIILDDTFLLLGSLTPELEQLTHSSSLARAAKCDPDSSLGWGGCLPGFLALQHSTVELMNWWKSRVFFEFTASGAEAQSSKYPSASAQIDWLWRDLPVGHALTTTTAPAVRLSALTTDELQLNGTEEHWLVDTQPLRLVDLAGIDPRKPWKFASAHAAPRRLLSESPELRTLTHSAIAELLAVGWTPESDRVSDAVPGLKLTPQISAWYQKLVTASLKAGSELPPNPFVKGQVRGFLDCLVGAEVVDGLGGAELSGISEYADLLLVQRPDLRAAFPGVRWSGRDGFIRWMWSHGLEEGSTSLALLPDFPLQRARRKPSHEQLPFGVNLVGYLTGDLGLGVAARRMLAALELAGIPCVSVSYDRSSSRNAQAAERKLDAPYLFNMIMITPDQLPHFVEDVGPEFFSGHYTIGLWFCETDVLTEHQISSFGLVDEVWAATEYLYTLFDRYDRVPVRQIPVPLVFTDPQVQPEDKQRLGLDERFNVLFSFDFLSVAERKNPRGLVQAYCQAFKPSDGARLILKGINGDKFPDQLEALFDAIADRPDIDIWDRYLSSRDRLALIALVDCYASLHRSEGLGLTMAEAISLGTPVLATAYSGNLDFMDESTALLVPYDEVLIGAGHLYPAEGHWAEPDVATAATLLRRLFDEPDLRNRLSVEAPCSLQKFSLAAVAELIQQRLSELKTSLVAQR